MKKVAIISLLSVFLPLTVKAQQPEVPNYQNSKEWKFMGGDFCTFQPVVKDINSVGPTQYVFCDYYLPNIKAEKQLPIIVVYKPQDRWMYSPSGIYTREYRKNPWLLIRVIINPANNEGANLFEYSGRLKKSWKFVGKVKSEEELDLFLYIKYKLASK